MSKELYLQVPSGNNVARIQVGHFINTSGEEVAILHGREWSIYNMRDKSLLKRIKFPEGTSTRRARLVTAGKEMGFKIELGGGGFGDVGLLDQAGKRLWTYRPNAKLPPMRLTGADLDKDGFLEFYTADMGGLHRVNHHGERVWQRDIWAHDVGIIEANDGSNPAIISLAFNGNLKFWTPEGQLFKEVVPDIKCHWFELCHWKNSSVLITYIEKTIYILDLEGKILLEHTLELKGDPYNIFGTYATGVKLNSQEEPYLAVLSAFSSTTHQSMLTVFTSEGKLIHQELLHKTRGLCAIPSDSLGQEYLLVGEGPGKIWRYQFEK